MSPPSPPPSSPSPGAARRRGPFGTTTGPSSRAELQARYRRRRAGAVLGVIAVIVVLAMLGSSGGHAPPRALPTAAAWSPFPLSHRHAQADTLIGGITPAQNAAIDRTFRYANYMSEGGDAKREVAITLDDGPSIYTPQALAVLQRERAPATFFEIGTSLHDYLFNGQSVLGAGYPIEDHTLTHPLLASLSPADQQREILGQADRLTALGAPYPKLFRPPYGSFNAATMQILREHRMLMVLWSVDTRDFSQPGVDAIVQTALAETRPGAIILMHDGGGPRSQTIAALPLLIHALRQRGYKLVTVPQMIADDPPAPGQAPPHNLSGQ